MENQETAGTSQDPLIEEGDILPGCSTFEDFVQAAYPVVMNGVKSSNNLPNHQQYNYFRTYTEFDELMATHGNKLKNSMQIVFNYMNNKRPIANCSQSEIFELIVDTNDKLLDRALKLMSGLERGKFNVSGDYGEEIEPKKHYAGTWNEKVIMEEKNKKNDDQIVKLCIQQDTVRPQTYFKDKINNRNEPWIPGIKEKPNSLKPLSVLCEIDDDGMDSYSHPYEYELDLWNPNESRLTLIHKPLKPKEIEDTQLIYVDKENELEQLVADLLQQDEFAVDLEHHNYRSFMGFTCLLQISTKDHDYLVDCLKLRHKLHILNLVFTKPNILKVFHGATLDIEWLQRDFSVYVVNMFDTYLAAKVLGMPRLSLAYLLHHFCQVESDKRFQLFDWRIRPLPEMAKLYARQDTHYLLYIYQKLNNELFEKGGKQPHLIETVYRQSVETCKRKYVKPLLNENSHMNLYRKKQRPFDARQLFALKEIFKWRDTIAREEDESPAYVLSNHMMMQIAQMLPKEVQGIFACCNPIPPLIRQHAVDIHKIILKAKEVPLVLEEESEQSDDSLTPDESVGENTSDEDWVEGEEDAESSPAESDDDEKDEIVVEAIKKRKRLEKTKPPYINIDEIVTDCSFSPLNDIIVIGNSSGDLLVYSYDNKQTLLVSSIEVHAGVCRTVKFSLDSETIFSGSVDKSIVCTNLEKKDMAMFYDNAHDEPVSTLSVSSKTILYSGDDGGTVKIWDMRMQKHVMKNGKNDMQDYISSILCKENSNYISCTSGEGVLTIYDTRKLNNIFSQSEHHKSDLTCSSLVYLKSQIICGSLSGEMILYKWGGTGEAHSNYKPLQKVALNCMVAVSDSIIITGWEDKKIRAYHLFPNQEIGVVGQHDQAVENIAQSRDGKLIASTSMDQRLKFWNIEYLDGYKSNTKNKLKFEPNLPSSILEDRSAFFADMAYE